MESNMSNSPREEKTILTSPRHQSQAMLSRVLTLEDENRRLRKEVLDLKEEYRALLSKNKLFQAKILELQARLLDPSKPADKYRSPLISTPGGGLVYRFERPQSARADSANLANQARVPLSARESTTYQTPRAPAPRVPSARLSRLAAPVQISANPTATERVLSEFERTRPSPYSTAFQRKTCHGANHTAPPPAPAPPEEEGLAQSGNACAEGLERLRADLEAGRVSAGTDVLVRVRYCAAADGQGISVRHRPARYEHAALELQQAVAITFHGWRVRCVVESHEWKPSAAAAAPAAAAAGRRTEQLAVGAFEVTVEWEAVGAPASATAHSKLRARRFPDTLALLASLLDVLSRHAELLAEDPRPGVRDSARAQLAAGDGGAADDSDGGVGDDGAE
jgi:hypothetical protein